MRCFAAAAVALCPVLALGDGRAPRTTGVQFRPGDGRSIYVATTAGLLISHDDGCSFRWICEQNIGYGGAIDPRFRIARDGTIFAATPAGLRVSRDGGCSFSTATAGRDAGDPGRIAEAWITAIDLAPTGEVWVATANDLRGRLPGRRRARRRRPAPADHPPRDQRRRGRALARVTADRGGVRRGAAGPRARRRPRRPRPRAGVVVARPRVRRSAVSLDRRGMTFRDVVDTASPIGDVAIDRTGTVRVAMLGGPAGAPPLASVDRGASFAPLAGAPPVSCIGQRGDGAVFGCGADGEPGFAAVARSAAGGAWRKVFRFAELAGPLDCPAGTGERDACAGRWPAVQQQLGATAPACSAPPAAEVPTPAPARDGGCCDTGTAPGGLSGAAMIAAACGGAALRRRRG